MDHHGNRAAQLLDRIMARQLADLGLGPTGQFPAGQLVGSDEGETTIAIGTYGDQMVINLGGPVHWLALPPAKAIEFARLLAQKARELLGK